MFAGKSIILSGGSITCFYVFSLLFVFSIAVVMFLSTWSVLLGWGFVSSSCLSVFIFFCGTRRTWVTGLPSGDVG